MSENASIGPIGHPVFDLPNNRTKAFLLTIFSKVEEIEDALENVLATARGTRICVRVLTRGLSAEQIHSVNCQYRGDRLICEVVIPVSVYDDSCIVYYSWNDVSRRTNEHQLADQMELLRKVTARKGHNQHSYTGYTTEVAIEKQDWAETDVDALLEIFKRAFSGYLVEFTPQSVADMLCSNWVSVVRHDGVIVSVAMAEIATVTTSTGTMQICELSEVATHPTFQKLGLSHMAFGQLLQALKVSDVQVIFSETRAISYGMMAVAHDAGMVVCGRSDQHCVIASLYSDAEQDGEYGNLVVYALPPRR